MRLISNDDVIAVVGISDCVDVIESVYQEVLEGAASHRPRSVISVPQSEGHNYSVASMDGVSRAAGVAAVRIRSDLSVVLDGRKTKHASSPGNYCGLILLFDIADASPLAILNDGILQQMRVAATAAVAARRLARSDSSRLGIVGAGGQARSHARAYGATFDLEQILVFSPTTESRSQFATDMERELGVAVIPVDEPEAVFEADLVALCTNATEPVLSGDWLKPGVHLSSVRHWGEVGQDTLDRVDCVIVHQPPRDSRYELTDRGPPAVDGVATPVPDGVGTIEDLIAGSVPGRTSDTQITYFLNNIGTGVQFAACAGLAYQRCVDADRGRRLPAEWFLQQVSD